MKTMHEYSLPDIYESEYGGYTEDFEIFCDVVTQGAALDIACGTGRMTTKLAELGLQCTGIDISQPMLDYAEEKSRNLGVDITYLNADMRDFDLHDTFDLITMAGNSFQALLTEEDQKRCLKSIAKHMKEKSVFIMNTRNTTSDELKTTKHFEYWHHFTDKEYQTVQVYGIQSFDPKTNIVSYRTQRIGPHFETIAEMDLKFTSYSDLSKILKHCGLEVIECYGSFKKEPYDPCYSHDMIVVCKSVL